MIYGLAFDFLDEGACIFAMTDSDDVVCRTSELYVRMTAGMFGFGCTCACTDAVDFWRSACAASVVCGYVEAADFLEAWCPAVDAVVVVSEIHCVRCFCG